MEIVKLAHRTQIMGNCSSFPRDNFMIEVRREDMYLSVADVDCEIETSVTLEPKDAIKMAETILEYYKSRGF